MSNEITIKAEPRDCITKRAIRELRNADMVPAVMYGKSGNITLAVHAKALPKSHTASNVVSLEVGGKNYNVLMREVQVNPLTSKPLHIDFQEVQSSGTVTVPVRLEFTGLTKEQEKEALFRPIRRSIFLCGPVGKAPEKIQVNVGALKVDETLHLEESQIPAGFELKSKVRKPALAQLMRIK